MEFLFWTFVILLALVTLGFWGILQFIGLMILGFILFILILVIADNLNRKPETKRKVIRYMKGFAIAGGVAFVTWMIGCNYIYHRYEVKIQLTKKTTTINDFENSYKDYTKIILAKSDSEAIAKVKPYAMKVAKSWMEDIAGESAYVDVWPMLVRKEFFNSFGERIAFPKEQRHEINKELIKALHIKFTKEVDDNKIVIVNESVDSLELDTIG